MKRQIKAVATQYFPIGYPHVTDILHGMTWLWFSIFGMLLVTDGYYFLVFIGLGFGLGRYYFQQASPTQLRLNTERTVREQEIKLTEADIKQLELFYPPLTLVINQLLDYVMRDFILSWWKKLNEHNDPTFEIVVRERLNNVALTVEKILMNQDRNDIVMSTIYGVANTLIIHMRECRAFEDSEVSINDYVIKNPHSPFAQLLSKEEQHRQLLSLSRAFIKRTFPANDRDSDLLVSLLKEILANFVFGRIVENLSDPDFLNCWIIDILSDNTPKRQTEPKQVTKHVAQKDAHDNREPRSVPNTPEPVRSSVHLYEPVIDDEEENASMVFALGSVNFVIMDISSPEPLNKSQLVYIIQIERPAAEDSVGSEGGGYVITRSYADFENFHTIINARHAKRVTRLGLKLPLGATRSWLKSSSTRQQKRGSLDSISSILEKYLDIVVADEELGTDPILLGFLRKERPSEINDAGTVMSFSEEFKDQVASAYAAESTAKGANGTKSRSLFSRHNQASSKTNLPENNSEKPPSTKSLARQDSASSLGSVVSKEELYEDKQRSNTKQSFISASEPTSRTSTPSSMEELLSTDKTTTTSSKSISSNDVELLIETTYALIVEVFDLSSTNNKAWMRRSILNLLREIVRRSYAEFIIEQYNALANEYMSPKAIVTVLNQLGEKLWPEGKWMLDGKTPKVRTEEDKEKSRQQARDMLLKCTSSSPVRQLVGDQNCDMAMERIWTRYQDKDLNRVLIIQVLERIAKPILG